MIITPVIPENLLPGQTIKATAWEISKQPVFDIGNYILGRMPFNILNKTSVSMDIDTTNLLSPYVYVRVQYQFMDDSISDFTQPFLFEIEEFIGVTNTSIIKIPKISVNLDYQVVDEEMVGHLILSGDEFRDYKEITTHAETIWSIVKDSGEIIHQVTANYVTSPENLRNLTLPLTVLNDADSYSINVTYVGTNAIPSGILAYKLQTYIRNKYFDARIIGEMIAGKYIYMSILPKTTKYSKISLQLVDDLNGNILSSLPDQKTLYPRLLIPKKDTADLSIANNGKNYRLEGKLTLTNGVITPIEIISNSGVIANMENVIDLNAIYQEKYSYAGTINTGINNIQCSVQLDDGSILIGDNVAKTISRYKFVAERLIKIDTPIVLDDSENIGPLYLNIVKRNDGTIVVNYGANTKYVKTHSNVFRLYRFNPANKSFTLLNQMRLTGMGYATSMTASMIVNPSDDIYFIPAYTVDAEEDKQPLQIYKINGTTWTINKTIPLPFSAKQNVSLIPTKEENSFLILGGSENKYEVQDRMVWKREHDVIYTFDAVSENISPTSLSMAAVDQYASMLQGFLRKDGKVILFNASDTGLQKYNHDVYLIDTTDWTIEHIANDLPDDFLYRSTIKMIDGGFIRISTTMNATNYVYHYPIGASASITNPLYGTTELIITVAVGETKYFNATDFEKVVIEGTSIVDTGKAVVLVDATEVTYDYRTLLIGKDVTIGRLEHDSYENIVVYNNAMLTIIDE